LLRGQLDVLVVRSIEAVAVAVEDDAEVAQGDAGEHRGSGEAIEAREDRGEEEGGVVVSGDVGDDGLAGDLRGERRRGWLEAMRWR
jgi:hypothetical protein